MPEPARVHVAPRFTPDDLVALADTHGRRLIDLRVGPSDLDCPVGPYSRDPALRVVHSVGTDCAIGKMSTALELTEGALARGHRGVFVPTGQTGIAIAGWGIAVDHVISDYVNGAAESLIDQGAERGDLLFLEGQGSLLNPASTATLPLIRGTQPTHLIVVAKAGVKTLRSFPHIEIPPLSKVVALYEQVAAAAGAFAPVPVVGIALNTWDQTDAEARASVEAAARETGLPCTDAVRYGPGEILDRILR